MSVRGPACLFSYNESQAFGSWSSSPQPATLEGDSGPKNSHSAQPPAHQPCCPGSHNALTMPLSVLPVKLDSVGPNCAFTLVSFLAEPLCMGFLPSLTSAPLLRVSIWPPHYSTETWARSPWTPPLKALSLSCSGLFHSLPEPPTVSGDRVSL